MSKYFAGIEPLKPGYEEISIKPNFTNLNKISSTVETIKGKIILEAIKGVDKIEMQVTVPARTLIAVPKIGNNLIKVDGKITNEKVKEEDCIYFYIDAGEHKIEVGKIQQFLGIYENMYFFLRWKIFLEIILLKWYNNKSVVIKVYKKEN